MPLLRVAFGEGFKCQKTSLARTGELHLRKRQSVGFPRKSVMSYFDFAMLCVFAPLRERFFFWHEFTHAKAQSRKEEETNSERRLIIARLLARPVRPPLVERSLPSFPAAPSRAPSLRQTGAGARCRARCKSSPSIHWA